MSLDVSFISLRLVLPAVLPLLAEPAQGVCLIKPQFETEKEKVGKKGVVRDISTHIEVINSIVVFAFETGFSILNIFILSPRHNIISNFRKKIGTEI